MRVRRAALFLSGVWLFAKNARKPFIPKGFRAFVGQSYFSLESVEQGDFL